MSLSDYYTSCAFPKAGRKPEAERVAIPAVKGPQARETQQKKLARARTKKEIREHVRELDGFQCRWPECSTDPETTAGALEVAHRDAEGRGGDPLLVRYVPENLILLCHHHHQSAPRSLHSGLVKMQALDPALGMRGQVQFFEREKEEARRWVLVGVTEPPRITE